MRHPAMIEESARVVGLEGNCAWVQTQRRSTCSGCSANKGCGVSVLDKVLGRRTNNIKVLNPSNAQVGDEVVLGIEESALVRGSLTLYAIPLASMMLSAFIGEGLRAYLSVGDWLTVVMGLAGLFAGLWAVRVLAFTLTVDNRYLPVIVRRAPEQVVRTDGIFTSRLS